MDIYYDLVHDYQNMFRSWSETIVSVFSYNPTRMLNDLFKSMFLYDRTRTWCEPDYMQHSYIAEFWNTISNIVLLLLSLYGIYWHHKLHKQIQKPYLACIAIAIGSAWYHATLSRVGQLADEIPMLILTTMLFYEFTNFHHLYHLTTLVSVLYIFIDTYAIFFIYFSVVTGIVLLLPIYMRKRPLQSMLYQKSMLMFLIGFFVWVIDVNFCTRAIQDLHLHSIWHICSGFALYWYIQFMMARYGILHHSFPLEVVEIRIEV